MVAFCGLRSQKNYQLELFIVDALSNEPLEFVNVLLPSIGGGGTTDASGKLILSLPENEYELQISYIGYTSTTRRVFLNRNITFDIFLESNDALLQTITVTAENDREILTRPELGVARISGADLQHIPSVMGEVDVLKGLQLSGGVNAAGEVSNGLSIRGGTIDQNLMLLDGAPIFTPTHLFGLFSVFTPDAVGGVDLYRGNIPAEYGGRIASVIDVSSQTPTSDQLQFRGSIGLVSSSLTLETPLDKAGKFKLLAGVRGSFNDFLFGLVERLKRTESRFADATVKLRYTASETSFFTLSSFYSYDFYQLELIGAISNINSELNQYQYRTLNGTMEWLKVRKDGKGDWRTRLISGNYKPQLFFPESDNEDIRANYRASVRQTTFNSRLSRELGKHRLKAGGQLDLYRIAPGLLEPNGSASINFQELPEEQGLEASAFAEVSWQFGKNLTIRTGLRYAHFTRFGPGERREYLPGLERLPENILERQEVGNTESLADYGAFEPRIGLSYLLGESNSLKLAYAESRQYLQYIFNATTPLPTSRWSLVDNNILPQRGRLYSAGWAGVLKPGRYRASVETYFREVDNILEFKPGADFFLDQNIEQSVLQGQSESWGIEVGVEKISGRITGQVNYTYSRTYNIVDGPTLASSVNEGIRYPGYFDQPHVFNANLVIDRGRTHELGFNFVLSSNRPYTVPNGFIELNGLDVPLFLERNNARLPTYHRLDFSWTIHNLAREKRRWTGDWILTIYNLYGRNNAENIFFGPKNANTAVPLGIFGASPLGSYQLSIFASPIFSLTYRFVFE